MTMGESSDAMSEAVSATPKEEEDDKEDGEGDGGREGKKATISGMCVQKNAQLCTIHTFGARRIYK